MAMQMGGSRRRGGRRGRRAAMSEINVTPLVDVMLVLLIIFMVTAPLLKTGVPVELPESRASALPEDRGDITVTLAPDGSIHVDDVPVAQADFAVRLARFEPGPDGKLPPVTLRADRSLGYGRVMAVLGELNRAGFTAIALVTSSARSRPPEGSPDAVSGGSDRQE